jgi:hypothetical protein
MEDPDASIFVNRLFPDTLSVTGLLGLRLFFTLIGFVGFISGWCTPT